MGDVRELLEKVKAGDHEAIYDIAWHHFTDMDWPGAKWADTVRAAYGGSLNDALALHKALLPGAVGDFATTGEAWVQTVEGHHEIGRSEDNPARAWLIAILRALSGDR